MRKSLYMVIVSTILLMLTPLTAFSLPNNTRTYLINVYTLNEEAASTNGDVYLKLYGDKGETAFWEITSDLSNKATTGTDRLQSGGALACTIRERDVGNIIRIQIAYYGAVKDDNTWGVDWFELDGARYPIKKTLVAESGYPCVLSLDLDNQENSRVGLDRYLVVEGRQYDKTPDTLYDKSYSIKLKTGNSPPTKTNDIVRIQLVGVEAESDWLTINRNNGYGNGNNVFKPNTEDEFFLSGQRELGEIKEIRLKMRTDSNLTDRGWLLESVMVGNEGPYAVNQWLKNTDYLSVSLDMPPDLMLIKTDPKTSASILSTPILTVIIGGSVVILTTAIAAVFVVKKRKRTANG